MDFEKFFQNSYGSESDGEQDFDPNWLAKCFEKLQSNSQSRIGEKCMMAFHSEQWICGTTTVGLSGLDTRASTRESMRTMIGFFELLEGFEVP